jgi:DNA-binding NarL/FixJ family response regulator
MDVIRVVLVEDLDIVREGIKALLAPWPRFEVVGEAGDGLEAMRIVDKCRPHIVLMDLTMPKMDGMDAIEEIKRVHPEIKVLALTAHKKDRLVFKTLDAGADGYMVKTASSKELVQAMETVLEGKPYLSPDISEFLIKGYLKSQGHDEVTSLLDTLSSRERQVLKLVAEGMTTRQIAETLFLSPKTVEKHRANLKTKLGAKTTADLVAFAIQGESEA